MKFISGRDGFFVGVLLFLFSDLAVRLPAAEPILRLETGGHAANCLWLDFTPDGKELVSLGADKVIRIWNVQNPSNPVLDRTHRIQIGTGQMGVLTNAAIAPQGDLLVVCGLLENNVFLLLDLKSGDVFTSVSGHEAPVHAVSFSADGNYLLSAGQGHIIGLSDVGAWRRSGKTQLPTTSLVGHQDAVFDCEFLGQAPNINVVSTSNDNSLRIWTGRGDQWTTQRILQHPRSLYYQVVPSPVSNYFIATAFNQPADFYSGDGKHLQAVGELTLNDPPQMIPVVDISADGRKLAYGLPNAFGLTGSFVYDLKTGKVDSRFTKHNNTVQSIAFHPRYTKGTPLIASAGGDAHEIYLWNGETGETVGEITGRGASVYGIATSADGKQIAFGQTNGRIITVNADHPLTQTFDLDAFYPGTSASDSWTPWQRRIETVNGWSIRTSEDFVGGVDVFRNGQRQCYIDNTNRGRVICYSFLPSGRQVIIGFDLGLVMYDSETGRVLKEFVGHESTIWSVAISPDGNTMYSASGDQTFRAWDLNGTPDQNGIVSSLLNFFVTADGKEWISWTNEGYYTGSPGADEFIGWHLNRGIEQQADFAAAWQYARVFRRPDVVSRVLQARSTTEAIRLATLNQNRDSTPTLNVAQNGDELAVPVVKITSPTAGSTTEATTIRVTGTARSTGSLPISNIRVLVNGRPASETRGFVVQPKNNGGTGDEKPFNLEVGLLDGENKIEVIASTSYASSPPVEVLVTRKAPVLIKPTLYVLGIGVAKYAQSDLNLSFPDDDIRQLLTVLKAQSGGIYQNVVTNSLIDDQVTDRNIRRALIELQRSVTQHDMAIVMLSGHGDLADGQYFYCPHDHDPAETSIYGIRFSDLTEPLTQLPCKVILCLDTCHAAGVLGPQGQRTKATTSAVNRAVAELTSVESGMVVMASSTGQQSSIEDDNWGHGAFALALIEALSGERRPNVPSKLTLPCDLNGDDILELTEVDAYVTARVKELTGGRQQPITERGRIPSFPIATVIQSSQ